MLVLTRKAGESIIVGDNIRITVVDIGQGRVKIGIEAPNDVSIDREEIRERKEMPIVVEKPAAPSLHNRIATKLPDADLMANFPPRKPR